MPRRWDLETCTPSETGLQVLAARFPVGLLSRSSAAAVNVNSVLFSFLIFAPSINSPLLNKEVLHVYGFRCEVNYEFYGFRVLASEFFLFQDYVDVHQCFQKSH